MARLPLSVLHVLFATSALICGALYFRYNWIAIPRPKLIASLVSMWLIALCTISVTIALRPTNAHAGHSALSHLAHNPLTALLYLALAAGIVWKCLHMILLDYFQPMSLHEPVGISFAFVCGLAVLLLVGTAFLVLLQPVHSHSSGHIVFALLVLSAWPLGHALIPLHKQELAPGTTASSNLWSAGEGDYAQYRIPALLAIPKENGDVLLAFAEARKNSAHDMGDIDLVMRRSEDAGATWFPQVVVARLDHPLGKCGNPVPLLDRETGTVFLAYNTSVKDTQPFQPHIISSTDNGESWSEPVSFGRSGIILGPGHGIQLVHGAHPGRLLIPAYEHKRGSFAYYSDDGGATWVDGALAPTGDENQIAETADGSLLMATRRIIPVGRPHDPFGRLFTSSTDGGVTWGPVREDPGIPTPICQASLLALEGLSGEESTLVFANPAADYARARLTLRISNNSGASWPSARVLFLGPSGYSDLTALSDGSIGVLFERGWVEYHEWLTFAKISPDWVALDSLTR